MTALLAEIRQAYRSLSRSPGLPLAAVVTLAIGAGSAVAIGTLVYSLLWRPLPGVAADRLALVYPTDRGALDGESDELSYAEAEEVERAGVVEALALLMPRTLTLTAGDPERIAGAVVDPDFFDVVGVRPLLGRGFRADEGARWGQETTAIVSHGFWQRRLAADPGAVGRDIEVNQRQLTVVGVLPPGFGLPNRQEIYLPWIWDDGFDRRSAGFWTVARLGDADPASAQVALDAVARRLRDAGVVDALERGLRLVPLRQALYDPHTVRITAVLSSLVFAVLLVACFNVANLLFARAASRESEVAVRLALGAGRGRILRQVLAESLLLAAAGCAGGLLLGSWGLDIALATLREEMPAWLTFELDGRLLAGAGGLIVLVTLVAGVAPALGAGRAGLQPLLVGAGRGGDAHRARRFQRLLVGAQFAASFVVLLGGFWLLGSVRALERADVGFAPGPLLTLRSYLPGDAYDPQSAKLAYRAALVERLAAIPGVAAVALTTSLPADDGGHGDPVTPAAVPPTREAAVAASVIGVTRQFFDALGAPLAAGEVWSAAEDSGAPVENVVVNRALADRLWPGEPALGQRLRLGLEPDAPVFTVAGLAPALPFEELHEQSSRSALQLFVPLARYGTRGVSVVLRAAQGDPAALAEPARRAFAALEPDAPVYDVLTYRARLRQSWEDRRLIGSLASVFAAQGLLLAAVGLFGVLAYAVARRRRELGVRMALGASPGALIAALVGDGLRFTAPGVVLGILLGGGAARALGGTLHGVDPAAPAPFLLGLGLLLVVAAAASGLAARRAAAIDPATALRDA
ncbi:MAG: ADOP family duplicated permease [Thermoanaerobaculia bacterium]|nr:ADOP family duplicated permease [Thermoanaerobaculia bacterium]